MEVRQQQTLDQFESNKNCPAMQVNPDSLIPSGGFDSRLTNTMMMMKSFKPNI